MTKRELKKGVITAIGPSRFVESGQSVSITKDSRGFNMTVLHDLEEFTFEPEIGMEVYSRVYRAFLDEDTDQWYTDVYRVVKKDSSGIFATLIESPYLRKYIGEEHEQEAIEIDPPLYFSKDEMGSRYPEVGDILKTVITSEIRKIRV